MRIAMDQFQDLRVLGLPDLDLPPAETFDKKILACMLYVFTCMHAYMPECVVH